MELLVVIGIIAVLISLLLPALNKARASSVRLKCLSNIRQMLVAATMYANDHKGTYPIGYNHDSQTATAELVPGQGQVFVAIGALPGYGYMPKSSREIVEQLYFCPGKDMGNDPWRVTFLYQVLNGGLASYPGSFATGYAAKFFAEDSWDTIGSRSMLRMSGPNSAKKWSPVMIADIVRYDVVGEYANHGKNGMNIGLYDGSARFINFKDITNPDPYPPGSNTIYWFRFWGWTREAFSN